MALNMSVKRPGNNQETWTHQLHMVIATINSRGMFPHKIQMRDMCLWQNYARKSVLIVNCAETGVGIIWGSHGLAHETAPVNLLFCYKLALHGAYIGRPMKPPM